MKRIILVVTLLFGLMVPDGGGFGSPAGVCWVTTAQAKHKKSKKHQTRQPRKRKQKTPKSSGAAGSPMPLIGSSAPVSPQPGNSLLRVTTPRGMNSQTLNYKALTIYFNNSLRIPNCVAYELTNTMVAMSDAPGAEKRKSYNFNVDSRVAGCPGAGDYRGSGYTRGHMAPAMDMRWDRQAMTECFYMTNMCPQEQKLNNGAWKDLEEDVHRWAKRDSRLIVLTGPIVTGRHASIGPRNNIAVPQAFYKVVYAPGQQRAIAFIYDNVPPRGNIESHAVSIDEVERRTGLDFFPTLPDDTERRIEAQCNYRQWK